MGEGLAAFRAGELPTEAAAALLFAGCEDPAVMGVCSEPYRRLKTLTTGFLDPETLRFSLAESEGILAELAGLGISSGPLLEWCLLAPVLRIHDWAIHSYLRPGDLTPSGDRDGEWSLWMEAQTNFIYTVSPAGPDQVRFYDVGEGPTEISNSVLELFASAVSFEIVGLAECLTLENIDDPGPLPVENLRARSVYRPERLTALPGYHDPALSIERFNNGYFQPEPAGLIAFRHEDLLIVCERSPEPDLGYVCGVGEAGEASYTALGKTKGWWSE